MPGLSTLTTTPGRPVAPKQHNLQQGTYYAPYEGELLPNAQYPLLVPLVVTASTFAVLNFLMMMKL